MTIPVFPTLVGLAYPAIRSPRWSADVMRSVTGRKVALSNYSYPVWSYQLQYNFLRASATKLEWQTLLAFYNLVNGPANVFHFTDPDDYTVTDQAFGTGDGVTTEFQLVRSMTGNGANVFVEPVWAINAITNVKVAGVVTAVTAGDTGTVTFAAAPANGAALTWTGTYYWLCRFDGDRIDVEKFAYQFWEAKKIEFSTEKL